MPERVSGTDAGTTARPHGGTRLSTVRIHSGTLVCMDAAGTIVRGDLLVEDGVIRAIGDEVPARLGGRAADDSYDASGCFVLPGFIHGHLHLCQTLFRGSAEACDLLPWLRERIWPFEAAHTPESLAASARLGLCQLLAGGVTCINDMGTVHHTETLGAVLEASGIRAVFGKALMDTGDGVPDGLVDSTERAIEESIAIAERFNGAGNGRLSVSLAPRFILTCSDALWREVSRVSDDRGMLVHTHMAESPGEGEAVQAAVSSTATRYFASRNVLGPRFVAAHGVWVDEEELGLLGEAGAALAHCPSANLKLAAGMANVRGWKRHGVRCGLGADGAACNNRLDTFHEMSLGANVSRLVSGSEHLSPREMLELATREGARALGLDAYVGSLEAGKQADVIVVDASGVHQAPNAEHDPYTTLVHATHASDTRLTMVAGRVLYRDGAFTTLDPTQVRRDADREALALNERAGAA